jgi:hypothetical protein
MTARHRLPMAIGTLALALVLNAYGVEVRAAPVVLSCSGTMQAVYTGSGYTKKGSASINETLSIEIDVAAKTLTIEGDAWPLLGDTSGTLISAVGYTDNARFSLVLNRITGAVTGSFDNTSEMLRMHQEFTGVCKAGQKLF